MNESQVLEFVGLFISLMGLGFVLASQHYFKLVDDIKNSSAILLTFGGLNLIIGYLLIVNFSVWTWSWSVLLPIMGWLALSKGVVILAFPKFHLRVAEWFANAFGNHSKLLGVILIVLGAALAYVGRFLV